MPSPPSLVEISFETLLVNIQRIPSEALETLPEQFVTELFEGVLARGMLNEPIFDTFELVAKTNERLDERIRTLNIRRLPPLPAKMTREWLKH
tara:strand:- start:278 stop:556 length:279 start_codon:yes stop_codon:yes gene_type:complete